jgi:hypothetical protein
MEKKSKKSATRKVNKYHKKFKVDMTFENAIGKIVNQPPKNIQKPKQN